MNKYLNYKNSRLWMFLGSVIACFVALIAACVEDPVIAILAMGIWGAAIIQPFFFYKCPYCKKTWDYRMSLPDFCPHCGHEIEY